MISSPKVILADEPTGALDTHTSYEVLETLKNINSDGVTVIGVTPPPASACREPRLAAL